MAWILPDRWLVRALGAVHGLREKVVPVGYFLCYGWHSNGTRSDRGDLFGLQDSGHARLLTEGDAECLAAPAPPVRRGCVLVFADLGGHQFGGITPLRRALIKNFLG